MFENMINPVKSYIESILPFLLVSKTKKDFSFGPNI